MAAQASAGRIGADLRDAANRLHSLDPAQDKATLGTPRFAREPDPPVLRRSEDHRTKPIFGQAARARPIDLRRYSAVHERNATLVANYATLKLHFALAQ